MTHFKKLKLINTKVETIKNRLLLKMQETWEVSSDRALIEKLLQYVQILHFYGKCK